MKGKVVINLAFFSVSKFLNIIFIKYFDLAKNENACFLSI